jgi:hypothetical protein
MSESVEKEEKRNSGTEIEVTAVQKMFETLLSELDTKCEEKILLSGEDVEVVEGE